MPSRALPAAAAAACGLFVCACGGAALDYHSRPPLPEKAPWHCVETATGSFCEKTKDACDSARRYVSQRSVAVRSTGLECKSAGEAFCFSYAMSPKHPPATREIHSVREPGVDGWVYDCAATSGACQRTQERIVSDRASSGDATSDVSPCERTQ